MPRTVEIKDPTLDVEGVIVNITMLGEPPKPRIELTIPGDPDGIHTVDVEKVDVKAMQAFLKSLLNDFMIARKYKK